MIFPTFGVPSNWFAGVIDSSTITGALPATGLRLRQASGPPVIRRTPRCQVT